MSPADQRDVIEFLSRPGAYGPAAGPVERIDTHGAVVFLAGARAYKLKRAVAYSYLDYSTVEKRQRAAEAELSLNRRTAPDLYVDIAPVTRTGAGRFAIGGSGAVVDWLVVMRRFDQDTLFDRLAARGKLDRRLILALADRIVAFHRAAAPSPEFGGHSGMSAVLDGDIENLRRGVPEAFSRESVDAVAAGSRATLDRLGALLDRRRGDGKVRRCHGDLHLRNICLIGGVPTLFDCIEFNDRLACVDVLHDLAFLLMDLDRRGMRTLANAAFNRYVDLAGEPEGDLAMLPLCLSLRAAIRAHVGVAAAETQPDRGKAGREIEAARAYLAAALSYMRPCRPCLIAVGGLSGSGKSTLAYGLAPDLGGALGARVLRSDVLRKRLAGVAPETRLPESAYGRDSARRVYEALYAAATEALSAGGPVVVDAVFADPVERAAIAAVASRAGVPFAGLWLEAPPEVLEARIAARTGDASDADVAVLRRQLGYDLGTLAWPRIDVSGDPRECLGRARAVLGRSPARGAG